MTTAVVVNGCVTVVVAAVGGASGLTGAVVAVVSAVVAVIADFSESAGALTVLVTAALLISCVTTAG